jgi:hypothetical protein
MTPFLLVDELSTPEATFQVSLALLIGFAAGWIFQGATVGLAQQIGERALAIPAIETAVKDVATGTGGQVVVQRGVADMSKYALSHPVQFSNAVS